jgi:hypothetical protein
MMANQYVFIVGLPRTGSKLVVNVLKHCTDAACDIVPETFFLGRFLRPGVRHKMGRLSAASSEAQVQRVADEMCQGTFSVFPGDYWSELASGDLGACQHTFRHQLLASDRSDKAIYTTMLQCRRPEHKPAILGDKTGPHLYHVPTLIAWFPDCKVVHTFRDPRAILASEHKKLIKQYQKRVSKYLKEDKILKSALLKLLLPLFSILIVFYIKLAWSWAALLHYKYQKRYPKNYYLLKFEDVIREPEHTIRELCNFLNITYHQAMLYPPRDDSSFNENIGTGFDKETLTRWRAYLTPWMRAGLGWGAKKRLRAFGYEV